MHHIMINKNTSLMQLISIYFIYSKSLHVSGRTLPIIRRIWYCTYQQVRQYLPHRTTSLLWRLSSPTTITTLEYILSSRRLLSSFNGLIPVADMYSITFSWWWAVSCRKHVETYYKWNIYLFAASRWCSYLSFCSIFKFLRFIFRKGGR